MIEGLVENLDFLHFNSNNAKRLIQALANICFALLIYDSLGGDIAFPEKITTTIVFHFFDSYQIIIPIILYLIVWVLFYWIVKVLIYKPIERVFILFYVYKFEGKSINELIEKELGGKISLDSNIVEASKELRANVLADLDTKNMLKIEENLNGFIVSLQILIIYFLKIAPKTPFNYWGNYIVLLSLIIGLLMIILKINRLIKFKAFLMSYEKTKLN